MKLRELVSLLAELEHAKKAYFKAEDSLDYMIREGENDFIERYAKQASKWKRKVTELEERKIK